MVKVETFLQKCLGGKGISKNTIHGGDVQDFVKSPFLFYCNKFSPPEEMDEPNAYMQLLMERGMKHEKRVIEETHPEAKPITYTTLEEGFTLLLQGMIDQVSAFMNMPILYLPEDLAGVPDIVELSRSHRSVFGKYHYVVKEIKSAKNIKGEHIVQGAFYNYILGQIQGYTPQHFFVINRDHEMFPFAFSDYESKLGETILKMREVLGGQPVSPTVGACPWPWENYCLKKAIEIQDVSLVCNVGPSKKAKLNDLGIATVSDLAKVDTNLKIKGIGRDSLSKLILSADAILEKRHRIIEQPELPKSRVEIFWDLEGTDEMPLKDGVVKVDYLIGVLVRENKKENFTAFVTEDIRQESQMFDRFLKFISQKRDFIIYHYSPYEMTRFKALCAKYGARERVKLMIERNRVDLLSYVRRCVAFPTQSNSLKEIARYLGFKWREDDIDALESIVLYLKYLEQGDRESLQRILRYNEDDCRATLLVKDFLGSLSRLPTAAKGHATKT